MARPREFVEATVLSKARILFASQGYNGTSIDDLVKATGLMRGSLYKAFGSKRNLFEKILAEVTDHFEGTEENLDLLTVALKELAPIDPEISRHCRKIVDARQTEFSQMLGSNLLNKMKES